MRFTPRSRVRRSLGLLVLAATFLAAPDARAQSAPPVQGTLALEGTMSKVYKGAETLIVTTIDGVRHVFKLAHDLVVHTPKGPSGLESLREGSHVAVHLTVDAAGTTVHEVDWIDDDGLAVTEGIVLDINNRKREIRLRLSGGRVETLRLTSRAAAEDLAAPGPGDDVRVIIYYTEEDREKVVHYFKAKK